MTTTYVGIVVRVTTLAAALALVLSDYVVRPLAASGVAALVSVAASVLAVLWPRSAATTVSLLGLAAAFLVSSRNTHGAALVTWIVVEATALWLVHQGYALAAAR